MRQFSSWEQMEGKKKSTTGQGCDSEVSSAFYLPNTQTTEADLAQYDTRSATQTSTLALLNNNFSH